LKHFSFCLKLQEQLLPYTPPLWEECGGEKGIYAQFSVSSKKDIPPNGTVIDFFSSAINPPLLGNKLIQYKI
jgi:hypothetical protein